MSHKRNMEKKKGFVRNDNDIREFALKSRSGNFTSINLSLSCCRKHPQGLVNRTGVIS